MVEEPDFPAEGFEDLSTEEQKATFDGMKRFGWKVSHLFNHPEGCIAVWCIVRNPAAKGWTQGYLMPDGKLVRYENKVRVSREKDEADD